MQCLLFVQQMPNQLIAWNCAAGNVSDPMDFYLNVKIILTDI